jgi:hypothetical protein
MKIAFALAFSGLFYLSAGSVIRADDDPSAPPGFDTTQPMVDPDGAPLNQPQRRPTQSQLEAAQKEKAAAEANKDWLVREYEHQLQLHSSANSSTGESTDIYSQLGLNDNLAKLAGLAPLTSDSSASTQTDKSASSPSEASSSAAVGNPAPPPPDTSSLLKPLITPFSAPQAAGLQNFYASLASPIAPSPLDTQTQNTSQAKISTPDSDTAIETPGLTAAQQDPAHYGKISDPALEPLPGVDYSQMQLRAADSSPSLSELPPGSNAAQLQLQQVAALQAPGTTQPTPQPPVAKPVLPNPNDPTPLSKMPQPDAFRAPIADPFDIFYR